MYAHACVRAGVQPCMSVWRPEGRLYQLSTLYFEAGSLAGLQLATELQGPSVAPALGSWAKTLHAEDPKSDLHLAQKEPYSLGRLSPALELPYNPN